MGDASRVDRLQTGAHVHANPHHLMPQERRALQTCLQRSARDELQDGALDGLIRTIWMAGVLNGIEPDYGWVRHLGQPERMVTDIRYGEHLFVNYLCRDFSTKLISRPPHRPKTSNADWLDQLYHGPLRNIAGLVTSGQSTEGL